MNTRRDGATLCDLPYWGMSDVKPTTTSGIAVRKYVHAMADSQALTLLSDVLYDVSFCFLHALEKYPCLNAETLAMDRRMNRPSSCC